MVPFRHMVVEAKALGRYMADKYGFRSDFDHERFVRHHDGQKFVTLRTTIHMVRWFFCAVRCTALGHHWVDASHAGPDSGDMDMYCDRCELYFHHQLY